MKKTVWVLLIALLLLCCAGCKSKEVRTLEKMIDEIGEVTLDKESIIAAAEEAYSALNEEDAAKVENISILTEARTVFDALSVDALIEQIGEVTLDSEEAILRAEEAYEALSEDAAERVQNLDSLRQARMVFKAACVDDLIDQIGTVTVDSEAAIQTARDAFDELNEEEAAYVKKADDLKNAEEKLIKLVADLQDQLLDLITSGNKKANDKDMEGAYADFESAKERIAMMEKTALGKDLLGHLDNDPKKAIDDWLTLIPKLCYKNSFVIRFENIAKYYSGESTTNKTPNYSTDSRLYYYTYMYYNANRAVTDYLSYKDYLMKTLKLEDIKTKGSSYIYTFSDKKGRKFVWEFSTISGYSVYWLFFFFDSSMK